MSLTAKRILVIEDEYMIAVDLKRGLAARGATVVGPTGNLNSGLDLVDANQLDAAVLDLNLEGEWTYPIADRLDAARVPYLFVTGYDRRAVDGKYADKAKIANPYMLSSVIDAVDQLVVGGAQ